MRNMRRQHPGRDTSAHTHAHTHDIARPILDIAPTGAAAANCRPRSFYSPIGEPSCIRITRRKEGNIAKNGEEKGVWDGKDA